MLIKLGFKATSNRDDDRYVPKTVIVAHKTSQIRSYISKINYFYTILKTNLPVKQALKDLDPISLQLIYLSLSLSLSSFFPYSSSQSTLSLSPQRRRKWDRQIAFLFFLIFHLQLKFLLPDSQQSDLPRENLSIKNEKLCERSRVQSLSSKLQAKLLPKRPTSTKQCPHFTFPAPHEMLKKRCMKLVFMVSSKQKARKYIKIENGRWFLLFLCVWWFTWHIQSLS